MDIMEYTEKGTNMEKLYRVRVRQFPAETEAVVRVLRVYGNIATVEAVEGHPFTNGTGDAIFKDDLWWYKVTKVYSFQLEPLPEKRLSFDEFCSSSEEQAYRAKRAAEWAEWKKRHPNACPHHFGTSMWDGGKR